MTEVINIYTDGSCVGNGSEFATGGWAAVLESGKQRQLRISGPGVNTTNNRMELQAAIEGLKAVKNEAKSVALYTDSQYVQKGCTEWLPQWKRNGWRGSNKKRVLNRDLWQDLDEQLQRLKVTVKWVRGHNGHPMNELVDGLAGLARDYGGRKEERRKAGDTAL